MTGLSASAASTARAKGRSAASPPALSALAFSPPPALSALAWSVLTPSGAALTADSALTFPSVRVVHRTLESSGKAGTNVAMAPSVSYSITVRLEVASRGRAVSAITRAVEQAGGVVTALDVTAGGNERLRVDVTCAARDTGHAEAIVSALAAIPDVSVRTVQLIAPGFGGINLEDISA